MSWISVSKTGLQDVYENLKTLTDPSSGRRIFKALNTGFINVLKPKLDTRFKRIKYSLQHVFIAVLKTRPVSKTGPQGVYEDLKTLTDPSF